MCILYHLITGNPFLVGVVKDVVLLAKVCTHFQRHPPLLDFWVHTYVFQFVTGNSFLVSVGEDDISRSLNVVHQQTIP